MKKGKQKASVLGLVAAGLFLSACSDPKISVNFHKGPDRAAVNELADRLATKGIRVTDRRDTSLGVQFTVKTNLEKAAFKKAVADVIDPLKWNPEHKSRLSVKITETSNRVLDTLSLQTGQEASVVVDWNRAEDGIFTITSGGSQKRTRHVCGVRATTEGVMPKLSFRLGLAGGDPNSEVVKMLRKMAAMTRKTAAYEIKLEGLTGDKYPWKDVIFFGADAQSASETNEGDALFVFENCKSLDDIYGHQNPYGRTGSTCHLTKKECAGLIRKRSGGDFFGVTGRQLEGNVQAFKMMW